MVFCLLLGCLRIPFPESHNRHPLPKKEKRKEKHGLSEELDVFLESSRLRLDQ